MKTTDVALQERTCKYNTQIVHTTW